MSGRCSVIESEFARTSRLLPYGFSEICARCFMRSNRGGESCFPVAELSAVRDNFSMPTRYLPSSFFCSFASNFMPPHAYSKELCFLFCCRYSRIRVLGFCTPNPDVSFEYSSAHSCVFFYILAFLVSLFSVSLHVASSSF